MAEGNVERFQRTVAAIVDGDADAVAAMTDPDVVIEPLRAATEGAYLGHDGVRRFVADTTATFEVFRPRYTDIRELGDRVLAIGSITIRGSGSGVETDVPTAAIAEYRGGLLVAYKDYGDSASARRAAGLEA